jgi:hypothetical protein
MQRKSGRWNGPLGWPGLITLACAGLLLAACGGGEGSAGTGGGTGGTGSTDAGSLGEVFTPSFDVVSVDQSAVDQGAGNADTSATADTMTGADAAVVAGQFGAPCQSNADCDSAVCLPGPNGEFCSKTCADDCPTGYSCKAKQLGNDLTYVCVPAFGSLCDPCVTVADCNSDKEVGNLCIPIGNDGSFCGSKCAQDKDCPSGYSCNTVTDPDSGAAVKQCQPKTGMCSCSPAAVSKGAKTVCQAKNLYGSCAGERMCTAAGLSACGAPVPAPEECNGKDDDCNGQTDDFDVTAKCFAQNEFGKCAGKLVACVDGKSQCDAPQPAPETCNGKDDDCDGVTDNAQICEDGNPCTQGICNTSGTCQQQPLSGPACDDGNACTGGDVCAAGSCQGKTALGCDDGNPCTKDLCAGAGGCQHSPQDGPCGDDGNACTLDVCAQGACSHPAAKEGDACGGDSSACAQAVCTGGICKAMSVKDNVPCVDDGNPCTQDVCAKGACSHPPVAFTQPCAEDANPCTADVCDQGTCTHQKLGPDKSCLEDGDPCTQDVCVAGACSHPPALANSPCVDDGLACTKDVCVGGKCLHQGFSGAAPGCAKTDDNPCTKAQCDAGVCKAVPVSNVPCADDGQPCTKDVCDGTGVCKHVNQNAPCNDGNPCTLTDLCDSASGLCKGSNKPNCNDNNPCTTDFCQDGQGCVQKNDDGIGCDDGNACTTGDKCLGGKCGGVASKNCDDGNPCTTDTCSAGCQHVNNTLPCTDDGNPCTSDACANGSCGHPAKPTGDPCDNKANNPCADGVCQSGVCKSVNNDKVCNDGNACTSGDKCVAGVCQGTAFKSCDDGNPCTTDSCDKTGACVHANKDGASCNRGGECPLGVCAGGSCLAKSGEICQATVKTDLCGSQKVPGVCSGSGKCTAQSAPPGFSCPGCNGICLQCTIFGGIQLKYCVAF